MLLTFWTQSTSLSILGRKYSLMAVLDTEVNEILENGTGLSFYLDEMNVAEEAIWHFLEENWGVLSVLGGGEKISGMSEWQREEERTVPGKWEGQKGEKIMKLF